MCYNTDNKLLIKCEGMIYSGRFSWVLTLQDKKPPFQDLYLCFCGRSICQPDHSIGPAAHPNYVLHYILEGKGEYRINNHVYSLSAGQGFLMKPNIMSSYKADHTTPWKYLWIGFDGSYAKKTVITNWIVFTHFNFFS